MTFRRPLRVKIEAQVAWNFAHDTAAGVYIGVCPALNLHAIGDTWNELVESANEAIALLLSTLLKNGELDAFLRARNWKVKSSGPLTPKSNVQFDVPFELFHKNSPRELQVR